MHHRSLLRTLTLLITAGIVACSGGTGGGGGTPDTPSTIDLSTKAGIVRELRVFSDVIVLSLDEVLGDEGQGAGSAKTLEQCDIGTTETTLSSRSETFAYFDEPTLPVSVTRVVADNCLINAEGLSTLSDGLFETGDGTDGADTQFAFLHFGENNRPYRARVISAADTSDIDLSLDGRIESRSDASREQARLNLAMTLDSLIGSESLGADIRFGDDDDRFSIDTRLDNDTVRVDGPVDYNINGCGGGQIDYQTLMPISFDLDDGFSDGRLRLTANNVTVDLVFNGSSLSYQVMGGDSGVITEQDLAAQDPC